MAVDLVLKDGIVIVNDRETVRSLAIDRGKIEGQKVRVVLIVEDFTFFLDLSICTYIFET